MYLVSAANSVSVFSQWKGDLLSGPDSQVFIKWHKASPKRIHVDL
jgi:hypothetical protein